VIATLTGKLLETTPLSAIIETQGIGYEVHIPLTTTEKLPPIGSSVQLYTHAVYRQDSAMLYGFHSKDDRLFFRLLVEKVSGIGPRIALSIMSRLSVSLLKNAIVNGDTAMLSKCPGIGKKTAERLVMELKDKVHTTPSGQSGISLSPTSKGASSTAEAGDHRLPDAVNALTALGYKPADADKSVRRAFDQLPADATTEDLIRKSLR